VKLRLTISCFFSFFIICILEAQSVDLCLQKTIPDKIVFLQEQISKLGKSGQFPEVIRYSRLGISLSQKARIDSATAKFYYFIASAYLAQSQTDSTLYYFRKAIQIAPESSTVRLHTWIQLIYTYNMLGKQDSAYTILNMAKKAARKNNSPTIQGNLEILEGNLLMDKTQYTQALQAYIRAYNYYQQVKDTTNIASALEGIAFVEETLENYSKALTYTREARDIFKYMHNLDRVSKCELSMADLYETMDKNDSAQYYYRKAISGAKQIQNDYIIGKAFRGLANISEKQGNTKVTEAYLQQALPIILKTDIKPDIANMYLALGQFYLKQKNFKAAKMHLEKSLKNNLESERTAETTPIYQLLAQVEVALKNYSKAYYYQSLYSAQKDSLVKNETAQTLAEIETRYRVDRKQQEIALLNEKNRSQSLELAIQRRNIGLLIAGLLMSGVFGTVGYRRYRLSKRLEMEQIRNRIAADFHDELGANLSSIAFYSDLLLKNPASGKDRTAPILENISQQAHGSISSINDLIWTIKPDNDVLEQTLVRMKEFANPLLESRNIYFEFVADDSLRQAHLSMNTRKFLYLIFKEAINNAVKYAEAASVKVQVQESRGMIAMQITDDGKGFDPATVQRGNGLGNMQARAQQLDGQLSIKSAPGQGTHIRLSFKSHW